MKRQFGVILILIMTVTAFSQSGYWVGTPPGPGWWLMAERLEPYEQGSFTYTPILLSGGVPMGELIQFGVPNMAGGAPDARYFLFSGNYTIDTLVHDGETVYFKFATFNWPGGIITPRDLTRPNRFAHLYSFICGCYDYTEDPFPPDSARMADGYGFWQKEYPPPPSYPYWHGYLRYVCHAHPCIVHPCPDAGGVDYKEDFVFTDSLYNQLPDDALLSGTSRLYFRANRTEDLSGSYVKLYLETDPENDTTVQLTYYGNDTWRGSFENSKVLGLRSFDKLVGKYYVVWGDTLEQFHDSTYVYVGLPRVGTSVDTVIIRTDSMLISEDFNAGLYFEDDYSGNAISAHTRIDSAGYRYSSFWVANSNLPDTNDHQRYERDYPSGSAYLWWDDSTYGAAVTFWRDSLYVVGGSLTVASVGAMSPIPNIDNGFTATTDTVINDTSRATKLIIVDQDPSNTLFSDTLRTDRIRAVAWQEYAGSADPAHCHEGNSYNPRWNHYWDTFVGSHGDTCVDTRHPCENRWGLDTGIMQLYRTTWETVFDSTGHQGEYPQTFTVCRWDSLTWNWQLNIDNGSWIMTDAMPHKMTESQQLFPDSCSYADCDSVPSEPNKEDLTTYGFHAGEGNMRRLRDRITWNTYIFNPPTPLDEDYADYVKLVRRYKYRGDLW
jgi:hypothetical protein